MVPSAGLQSVGGNSLKESNFRGLERQGGKRSAKAPHRNLGAGNKDSTAPLTLVAIRGDRGPSPKSLKEF